MAIGGVASRLYIISLGSLSKQYGTNTSNNNNVWDDYIIVVFYVVCVLLRSWTSNCLCLEAGLSSLKF